MELTDKNIFVAGATGMVGSALVRRLRGRACERLLVPSHSELDLTDQRMVNAYFESERPQIVLLAAARVGGILANDTYRADFIYQNLMIETCTIEAARRAGVEKMIFLGSSCIYPRNAVQPMREEELLTGPLENTNEPYAIAKIAGIKLCENYYRQYGCNFYSVMPTNLFGPNDNYDLATSHVIPALIRKFHEAKVTGSDRVTVWGSGRPRREFLFVEDLADAVIFLLERVEAADVYEAGVSHINIGSGRDLTIAQLAEIISGIVGFEGTIVYDESKPDGTPRKLLDVSRLEALGWTLKTELEEGLRASYAAFLKTRTDAAAN